MEIKKYKQLINQIDPIRASGKVKQVIGLLIEAVAPATSVGEICELSSGNGTNKAEVVGFRDSGVLLMPLGEIRGIGPGTSVYPTGKTMEIQVGDELLGRIIDGLGNPIDGKGPIFALEKRPVYASPPHPLKRQRIKEPLVTGVRAIDGFITCGKGQRVGIFSGSGVGKSILLGMIARKSKADVNVIALIGERGREVREFIEKDLGEEGLKKSCCVVSTSDKPPLIRLKAPLVATTIAEYFRDKGLDVILMMDSITRIAMAQRDIGLAIGEPPTTKGYTPSIFAMLPQLLERAGMSSTGSITGFYTVLVEADDMSEPVADATRSILDGHIVLSRKLATKNHYPAIDIPESISRVMIDVVSKEHLEGARRAINVISTYRDNEDLISIGAYKSGENAKLDYAVSRIEDINRYLKQGIDETTSFEETVERLINLTTV